MQSKRIASSKDSIKTIRSFSSELESFGIEDLKRRIRDQYIANKVVLDADKTLELNKQLKLLIEDISKLLDTEITSFMTLDERRKQLEINIAREISSGVIKQVKESLKKSISIDAVFKQEQLLIKDSSGFSRRFPRRKSDGFYNDSLLSAPLILNNETIGVINVNNKSIKKPFNKGDLNLLQAIIDFAILEIKNSQDYEELKKLNEAKSYFISVASHELRAPLSDINGCIDLLLDGSGDALNKEQRNLLSVSKKDINRTIHFIDELLDITKIESGHLFMHRCFFDINKLIKNAIEKNKSNAEKKSINIKVNLDKDLKGIWADPDKLMQVLDNLISNALKFTPAEGEVSVCLSKTADNEVSIFVEDTGVGIPKEKLDKIFDRGSGLSVDETGKIIGPGLGLLIAKDIIQLHRGLISVDSTVAKGSKFTIKLPIDLRAQNK